jgi:hypothetical protein
MRVFKMLNRAEIQLSERCLCYLEMSSEAICAPLVGRGPRKMPPPAESESIPQGARQTDLPWQMMEQIAGVEA